MPHKISDVLGITEEALSSEGAFNAFVDIDSRFYIDPHLVESASTPEFKGSYENFKAHFENIIHLLDASKRKNDLFYQQALKRLIFHELHLVALGYSSRGTRGSGIGPGLASRIVETASEIVNAGIKDPVIFELVGLFEEKIGADRISDMTISIILPNILEFSERVAKNLGVTTKPIKVREVVYNIPYSSTGVRPVILIPKEVLTPLPIALDWDEIDYVGAHNEQLRQKVNRTVGNTWKLAAKKLTKGQLRAALLKSPDSLRKLIQQYKDRPANKYNFELDPAGEIIWHEAGLKYASLFPLKLEPVSPDNILKVVTAICLHFRTLVEDNGLFQLFYDDSQNRKHERAAQLLFFGVADAYCEANNLELSREPNAGRGPVDFRVSKGYKARVNVEVKYSSNTSLLHGYTTQLPIYDRAEKTFHSIYLIIRTTESTATIDSLLELQKKDRASGKRVPDIIIVDGRYKPSASKA